LGFLLMTREFEFVKLCSYHRVRGVHTVWLGKKGGLRR
jgi:hypothetical protein